MKLIITFIGTTQAMAWEKRCKNEGLPGRLIPLPPQIDAACGLAWLLSLEDKEVITKAITEHKLPYAQILELKL